MKIRNFIHKGLKKLYEDDSVTGVPPDSADKLRKMFAFLDDMEDAVELRSLPTWKVHTLTGDRKAHGASASRATDASRSLSTSKSSKSATYT